MVSRAGGIGGGISWKRNLKLSNKNWIYSGEGNFQDKFSRVKIFNNKITLLLLSQNLKAFLELIF